MTQAPKSTPRFTDRPWRRLSRTGSLNGLAPGVATALNGIRYEIIAVAGAAQLSVRVKVSGNGGVIDLIPLGPDFDPTQRVKNVAFASLVGTKYTTNAPTQVAVAAGTEALIQASCLGEGYFLVKYTGAVGAGAIVYVDVSQSAASARVGVPLSGGGAPVSGPTGTGAGTAIPGTLYLDTSMSPNVVYVNVGSKSSPSWMSLLSGNVV